jgi:hypothetical protein
MAAWMAALLTRAVPMRAVPIRARLTRPVPMPALLARVLKALA